MSDHRPTMSFDDEEEVEVRRNASEDQARARYAQEFGTLHSKAGITPSPAFLEAQKSQPTDTPPPHPRPLTDRAAKVADKPEPAKPQRVAPVLTVPAVTELDLEDPVLKANPYLTQVALKTVEALPSKGLPYPPGAHIRYRTYSMGEVEQFEGSTLTNRERYLMILRGVTTNFPKLSLTLSDVMYLGLLRRISTMGTNKVIVNTACPRCSNTNSSMFETNDTEFDDLEVPSLPVNVPFSFGTHSFTPFTIGNYFTILDRGEELDTVKGLALQCTTMPYEEAELQFRTLLDPKDISLARRLDKLLYHGIREVHIKCRHEIEQEGGPQLCQQLYSVALENSAEAFIYPFRGVNGDVVEDEISFG